jgi:hypothetical protein
MSLNDYEGFKVVFKQERGGWWLAEMTHLASGRRDHRIRRTRRECEEALPEMALWLTDPDRYYATLGER